MDAGVGSFWVMVWLRVWVVIEVALIFTIFVHEYRGDQKMYPRYSYTNIVEIKKYLHEIHT